MYLSQFGGNSRTFAGVATILFVACLSLSSFAAPAPSPSQRIPKNKWFRGNKGLEKAVSLQQETGVDILVYFTNYIQGNQKGLCRWFEKSSLKGGDMGKLTKMYIKVQIDLPGGKHEQSLSEKYRVGSCPKLLLLHENGFTRKVSPFSWENRNATLKKPEVIAAEIHAASSDRQKERIK